MQVFEAQTQPGDERYAIVVARWNDLVTRRLLSGAIETLRAQGVSDKNISVAWVPGSFELPLVADRLAKSKSYAAVICLGAVVQGETSHHEYINHSVSGGLTRAGMESGLPVIFGVLTCSSMEQALERAGGRVGNKGSEAALTAIEMVNLLKQLP